MAAQVESLVLQVRSDEVSRASRRLDSLSGSAHGAEGASRKLTNSNRSLRSSFLAVAGPLAAAAAGMAAFKKALDIGVQTQDFRARLKTATGSVEDAAEAFKSLEDFASRTPYQLEQSLEAFTKLTNLGLTPSERALESYGNTASAMGKDLTQLIEAVADATTGEFERLKEFGIKAKSQGDQVSFTFRGVTQTIGKNAAEIEKYLMALGENEFAGAMADRMDTLGGKVSNLGDTWNELWRTINDAGVGQLLEDTIQTGIDILEEFNALLQSGQVENSLHSWTVAMGEWADDFEDVTNYISELFGHATDYWEDEGTSVWKEFIRSMKLLPATIRYWMKRVGIEIATLGMYAHATVTGIIDTFIEGFKVLVSSAKTYGLAIAQGLNPLDKTDFKEAFRRAAEEQAQTMAKAGANIQKIFEKSAKDIDIVTQAKIDALEEVALEFGKTADRVDQLTNKSKSLRVQFELEKELDEFFKEVDGDRLAKFKIKPDPTAADGKTTSAKDQKQFQKLLDQLRSEERALEGSYLKRLEIVRKNTESGSMIRAELEEKLRQEYEASLEEFQKRKIDELDFQKSKWKLELDGLADFYARRQQLILDSETLTQEEKTQLIAKMERERADLVKKMEQERFQQGLDAAKTMFAGYATLAESSNKTLSRIGKTALAAQKAVSVAQTVIKTYEAATSAYAAMAGIPVVGPALGAAAAGAAIAAGMANVAAIRKAPSAGSFEHGGIVPGGSYSGDRVTANVNSGEMILNRQQQANLFKIANQTGGSGGVTIINQTTGRIDQATVTALPNGEKQIIIREAVSAMESKLTREAISGGGTVFPAGQAAFNWRRTGT